MSIPVRVAVSVGTLLVVGASADRFDYAKKFPLSVGLCIGASNSAVSRALSSVLTSATDSVNRERFEELYGANFSIDLLFPENLKKAETIVTRSTVDWVRAVGLRCAMTRFNAYTPIGVRGVSTVGKIRPLTERISKIADSKSGKLDLYRAFCAAQDELALIVGGVAARHIVMDHAVQEWISGEFNELWVSPSGGGLEVEEDVREELETSYADEFTWSDVCVYKAFGFHVWPGSAVRALESVYVKAGLPTDSLPIDTEATYDEVAPLMAALPGVVMDNIARLLVPENRELLRFVLGPEMTEELFENHDELVSANFLKKYVEYTNDVLPGLVAGSYFAENLKQLRREAAAVWARGKDEDWFRAPELMLERAAYRRVMHM